MSYQTILNNDLKQVPDLVGAKVPAWVMQDPFMQAAENIQQQQKDALLMEAQRMSMQKEAKQMQQYDRQESLRQGVTGFLQQNPGAKESDIYGAVQQEALKAGDVDTYLEIAKQMSQQEISKTNAERQMQQQAAAEERSKIVAMTSLARVNPEAGYNFAIVNELARKYGLTKENLTTKEKPKGGGDKFRPMKPTLYTDKRTGEDIWIDTNSPEGQNEFKQISKYLSKPKKEDDKELSLKEIAQLKKTWDDANSWKPEGERQAFDQYFGQLQQDAEILNAMLGGPQRPANQPMAPQQRAATTGTIPQKVGATTGTQNVVRMTRAEAEAAGFLPRKDR